MGYAACTEDDSGSDHSEVSIADLVPMRCSSDVCESGPAQDETPPMWVANDKMLPFLSDPIKLSRGVRKHLIFNKSYVAYDGKISEKLKSWGAGLQDLYKGSGHFVGGPWKKAARFCKPDGTMDIAAAEALAMNFSIEWVRKRDKPSAWLLGLANPGMMMIRHVCFMTDRTATLSSMMAYKSAFPVASKTDFKGFQAATHLCSHALVKLLLCVEKVTFIHKKTDPVYRDVQGKVWEPDTLAMEGCENGNLRISEEQMETSFHLLRWSKYHMPGSLLLSVDVQLTSIEAALKHYGYKDYATFLKSLV